MKRALTVATMICALVSACKLLTRIRQPITFIPRRNSIASGIKRIRRALYPWSKVLSERKC